MKIKRMWLVVALLTVTLATAIPPASAADFDGDVYVTAQSFERGKMFWRSDTGHIWVFCDSGQLFSFPAEVYSSLPNNPYNAPRIMPTNGFGKIWGSNWAVRSLIGWATTLEIGFTTRLVTQGTTSYLTELDRKIIRIMPPGSWQYVDSIPTPPVVPQITVTNPVPNPVDAGSTVSLGWWAQGAKSVSMVLSSIGGGQSTLIETITDLPLHGTRSIVVPADIAGDLEITVWAANSPSQWLTGQSVVVRVQHPATETLYTQAAYQPYERGFMLWREDTGDVAVFRNVGQVATYPETLYAQYPDNPITAVPTGFVLPVNAFGKVWGNHQYERDMLGYAVGTEQAYTMTVRLHAETPEVFRLPDGRWVYIIGTDWTY